MSNIYILCGLPGSGKSTWARNKVKEDNYNTLILSKDDIRTMIHGEYQFNHLTEDTVKDILMWSIMGYVVRNKDIILDETHISKVKRVFQIESIKNFLSKRQFNFKCVYFTSQEGNLERRMKNPRGISKEKWNEVIENMKCKFEPPTLDEGFDEIIEVKIG
jgi:predicted kinase